MRYKTKITLLLILLLLPTNHVHASTRTVSTSVTIGTAKSLYPGKNIIKLENNREFTKFTAPRTGLYSFRFINMRYGNRSTEYSDIFGQISFMKHAKKPVYITRSNFTVDNNKIPIRSAGHADSRRSKEVIVKLHLRNGQTIFPRIGMTGMNGKITCIIKRL